MLSCTDLTALIARLAISFFTNFKANNKSQMKKRSVVTSHVCAIPITSQGQHAGPL